EARTQSPPGARLAVPPAAAQRPNPGSMPPVGRSIDSGATSMMLTLGLAFWITSMLVVLFFLISLLLMLIVLIQRPQGGGLSGAFGAGAGSGQTAFGVKTGDALTWATIVGFALFLGMAVALNFAMRPDDLNAATQPAATGAAG